MLSKKEIIHQYETFLLQNNVDSAYSLIKKNKRIKNLWKLFEEKFGEATLKSCKKNTLEIWFSKCITKDENDYASKLFDIIALIEEKQKQKHLEIFCKIFKENCEYWWD